MKINTQNITISKLHSFHKCKKKFILNLINITPKREIRNKNYWLTEKIELEKLFVSQLKATDELIDCQHSQDSTEKYLVSKKPIMLYRPKIYIKENSLSFFLLKINHSGTIDIYDLKITHKLKQVSLLIMTHKINLFAQAGYNIGDIKNIYVDHSFIYKNTGDYEGLFKTITITDKILEQSDLAKDIHYSAKVALAKRQIPKVKMAKHCYKPFSCEHIDRCIKECGKEDIPKPTLIKNKEFRAVLDALPRPFYYFDIEAISFKIPRWLNSKPSDHIPFQYSCHVEQEDGTITHHNFLDTSGNNPIQPFTDSLIKTIALPGTILVYDNTLENSCLELCAQHCPKSAKQIKNIIHNITDLLPLVKKYYYHESMNKSYRLKSLAPSLNRNLSYTNLDEVQNGIEIQDAYYKCIVEGQKNDLEQNMLKYCNRDTEVLLSLKQAVYS